MSFVSGLQIMIMCPEDDVKKSGTIDTNGKATRNGMEDFK